MASTDSPWQAIVSAALLGTERQPFRAPIAPSKLGHILTQLNERSPESALLSAAAAIGVHQRVGWLPETRPLPSGEPCPSGDLPRCSPRAAHCLQQMLQGQFPQLLSEWLEKAAIAKQRVPEMVLPALLSKGRQQRDLRPAILSVLGQRGRWLAAQNPDWSYAVSLTSEADWETGTPDARMMFLQDLRFHDPARARDLLQSTWSQETAGDRTKFLEAFRTGISPADEPFLEMALGDRRSKEVRRVASDLLAHLPDSHLCQQMVNYIQPYVALLPGSPPSLTVQPPDTLDPNLIQLGIEPKLANQPLLDLGEKARWLLQMIGATPLSFWVEAWGMSVAKIVSLTQDHKWQTLLFQGWALAAQRQGDRTWIMALLKSVIHRNQPGQNVILHQSQIATLFGLLSLEQQNTFLLDLLQLYPATISQPLIIHLLSHGSGEWSCELAQEVLTRLENYISDNTDFSKISWELRTNLKEFARFIPVSLLPEVLRLQSQLPTDSVWTSNVEELASLLQFRQGMVQAFEESKGVRN